MPKPQCQSTNAKASAKAQSECIWGAAAPIESSSAGPSGALLALWALASAPVLLLLLLLLSVGDAVLLLSVAGAVLLLSVGDAVEEAVLLMGVGAAGGGQVPLTKCVTVH